LKVENPVDLQAAKRAFTLVEQETSDFVVGTVVISNAPVTPHAFVSRDGWVAVYFLKDEAVGNAWPYGHGFKPPDNVLAVALAQVSATVGGDPTDISYFNFKRPGANKISVIYAAGNGDGFEVQIPNNFQVFEAATTGYHGGNGVYISDVTSSIQTGQFQGWGGAFILVYREL
jgi:hypothetical protein